LYLNGNLKKMFINHNICLYDILEEHEKKL